MTDSMPHTSDVSGHFSPSPPPSSSSLSSPPQPQREFLNFLIPHMVIISANCRKGRLTSYVTELPPINNYKLQAIDTMSFGDLIFLRLIPDDTPTPSPSVPVHAASSPILPLPSQSIVREHFHFLNNHFPILRHISWIFMIDECVKNDEILEKKMFEFQTKNNDVNTHTAFRIQSYPSSMGREFTLKYGMTVAKNKENHVNDTPSSSSPSPSRRLSFHPSSFTHVVYVLNLWKKYFYGIRPKELFYIPFANRKQTKISTHKGNQHEDNHPDTLTPSALSSSSSLSPFVSPTLPSFDLPRESVLCRSYYKLHEIISTVPTLAAFLSTLTDSPSPSSASSTSLSPPSPSRRHFAIDIGASPGAWSNYLAIRYGYHVISVDPGEVKREDEIHKRGGDIIHLKKKIQESENDICAQIDNGGLSLIVCDMNIHPQQALKLIFTHIVKQIKFTQFTSTTTSTSPSASPLLSYSYPLYLIFTIKYTSRGLGKLFESQIVHTLSPLISVEKLIVLMSNGKESTLVGKMKSVHSEDEWVEKVNAVIQAAELGYLDSTERAVESKENRDKFFEERKKLKEEKKMNKAIISGNGISSDAPASNYGEQKLENKKQKMKSHWNNKVKEKKEKEKERERDSEEKKEMANQ